jgi:hypothetical protein
LQRERILCTPRALADGIEEEPDVADREATPDKLPGVDATRLDRRRITGRCRRG